MITICLYPTCGYSYKLKRFRQIFEKFENFGDNSHTGQLESPFSPLCGGLIVVEFMFLFA